MRKFLIFLFAVNTLVSCDRFTANNSFNLIESKSVSINNIQLSEKQKIEINNLLNELRSKSQETISKPEYIIKFKKGSEEKYISIFVKESFVYKGFYLESWTERMVGKESKGYNLNSSLLRKLKKYR